jgi:hypothetical protein
MVEEEAEEDDDIISEIPEYSPKSEFSKPRVVELAITKCLNARGNEMKEGYFNTKLDKAGNPIKTWVPDSRDVFFGCVMALRSLLSPEIKRDKKTINAITEFDNECVRLKDIFVYEEFIMYSESGTIKYKKTGNTYIPLIDAKVIIETFEPRTKKNVGLEIKGGWNDKVNAYKNELIDVYDYLFSELNDLIDRLNYFKQGVSF